jgi:hypothetical protein
MPLKLSSNGALCVALGLLLSALAAATRGVRVATIPLRKTLSATVPRIKAKLPCFFDYFLLGQNGYPSHYPVNDFCFLAIDALEQLAGASNG